MAKMYGDRGREQWDSPDNKTKSALKGREDRQWKSEFVEEVYEDTIKHTRGICFDQKTKMYGCDECYDSTDYFDGSELDDIPGVWTDTERLI